jgi:hypothetical protein
MTMTCAKRIEEIQKLEVYRAVVSGITGWGTAINVPSAPAYMSTEFPDPVTYGARIDMSGAKWGDGPVNLEEAAASLGPNSGDDSNSLAGIYADVIGRDLDKALAGLDASWKGEAADEFIGHYMRDLLKHLQNLAGTCEKH